MANLVQLQQQQEEQQQKKVKQEYGWDKAAAAVFAPWSVYPDIIRAKKDSKNQKLAIMAQAAQDRWEAELAQNVALREQERLERYEQLKLQLEARREMALATMQAQQEERRLQALNAAADLALKEALSPLAKGRASLRMVRPRAYFRDPVWLEQIDQLLLAMEQLEGRVRVLAVPVYSADEAEEKRLQAEEFSKIAIQLANQATLISQGRQEEQEGLAGLSDAGSSIASLLQALTPAGATFSSMAADRYYRDKYGVVAPAPEPSLPAWVLPVAFGALGAVALVAYSSKKKPRRRR